MQKSESKGTSERRESQVNTYKTDAIKKLPEEQEQQPLHA